MPKKLERVKARAKEQEKRKTQIKKRRAQE